MIYFKIPYQYTDSISGITIDRKEYMLRFTYNDKFDYWTIGIYDSKMNPLSIGMKIMPNYPLNHYCKKDNTPSGVFAAMTFVETETIGMKEVKEESVIMTYVPYDELSPSVRIYEE